MFTLRQRDMLQPRPVMFQTFGSCTLSLTLFFSCSSDENLEMSDVELIGGEAPPTSMMSSPTLPQDASPPTLDQNDVEEIPDESPPELDQELPDQMLPDAEPMSTTCDCYAGVGQYCASLVRAYATDRGCTPPPLSGGDHLWSCAHSSDGASVWTELELCGHGCEGGELASADRCALPPCECFVRVSWCGASAGRHGEDNLSCRVPLLPEHDNDLLGCDQGEWVVLESCEYGCLEQATGTPDDCRLFPDLGEERWPDCPSAPLLHSGLHPEASDRLRCAGVTANRITQTIGSAPASAGYHASDGTANGQQYCAAVDLRTRDLSTAQVRSLLDQLGRNGFAAWYRQPGADGWPSNQSPHIHAVFAGVRMKSQLRGQVRDFLENRNGLSSHSIYRFWDIPVEVKALISELFGRHYTP